jgi:hypothetical protein
MSRRLRFNANNAPLRHSAAFGRLLTADQKLRVDNWLSAMPQTHEMSDPADELARDVTFVELVKFCAKDFENQALVWLKGLDTLEHKYREIGLAYHKIPYKLRHTPMTLLADNTEAMIVDHLSKVFEKDQPRSEQTRFVDWFTVKQIACEVLQCVNDRDFPFSDDESSFEKLNELIEQKFLELLRVYEKLERRLDSLEKHVRRLAERKTTDGLEALETKYSVECGLFRLWILSFPELNAQDEDEQVIRAVDNCAEMLLKDGPGLDKIWSNLDEVSLNEKPSSSLRWWE